LKTSRNKLLSAAALSALGSTVATSAFAQAAGGGGTWGNRAAAMGQDALNWGSILGMVLYILALIFLIAFGTNLFGLGKRNGNSSPGAAMLCLVAAVACASAPTVLGITSQTITGAAPSITGSGTAPVQF
jgi:hypothetical protein